MKRSHSNWPLLLGAVALVFTLVSANVTSAADVPEMVIFLADGTRVVGRLVEVHPGESCTVQVTGNGRRVIPWTHVQRIVPNGSAEANAPSAPSSSPISPSQGENTVREGDATVEPSLEPAPQITPPSRRVIVHIDAPETVRLEMTTNGGPWQNVCTSPCDESMLVDAGYRIVRHDAEVVGSLRLDPNGSDRIVLRVRFANPGLKGLSIAGIVVGSIGALGALTIDNDESASAALVHLLGVGVTIVSSFGVALSSSKIVQRPGSLRSARRWNVGTADAPDAPLGPRSDSVAGGRTPDFSPAFRGMPAPRVLSLGFRF